MRLQHWLRLLARHGFRVDRPRISRALEVTAVAALSSALHGIERVIYGRRVAETRIEEAPIFIVGHWRTGTTYMHELLSQDDRFAFPTTYECFAPNHFLVSEWIAPRLMKPFLAARRPMDDMAIGFERPQEDEYALCNLGAPSPYLRIAFPNEPPPYEELLDMEGVDPREFRRFREALMAFAQKLTFRKKKPLIFKSPQHTGRIRVLSDIFPGARFIHMVRDPLVIFPSTMRLWQALDETQGLQVPTHKNLDESIFRAFERMYRGFEKQRPSIDASRICDVRYEDLVRDPLGQVEALYQKLGLPDFEPARERVRQHVDSQKNYRPNRHELEPEIKAEIRRRWAGYFERFGYE